MSVLYFVMTQMPNIAFNTASAWAIRVAGHMRSPTVETGYRDKYSQRNLPLDGGAGVWRGSQMLTMLTMVYFSAFGGGMVGRSGRRPVGVVAVASQIRDRAGAAGRKVGLSGVALERWRYWRLAFHSGD
jgi:hypothetical protein